MGRVLFLASLTTILLIGNANRLAAQGHAGGAAHGGGVSAGAGGAMHGGSMGTARAAVAGHVTSSPGSHLAIPRSPSGQIMARRASTLRGTSRYNGSTSARTRQFRSQRGVGTDFSNESNVPGLGFDAAHVAATRGNRGRDRGERGRGRGNEFGLLFPFFDGGGYYVPTGPDMLGYGQGDGQAVEDAEDQGPGEDDRPDRPPYRDARMGVERLPMEQPTPQKDVEQYVFVRRDGTVFFAVAYSWDEGSLRYISSEGMKHSVSRDTLDLKATQQFNEERGLTFRAPA